MPEKGFDLVVGWWSTGYERVEKAEHDRVFWLAEQCFVGDATKESKFVYISKWVCACKKMTVRVCSKGLKKWSVKLILNQEIDGFWPNFIEKLNKRRKNHAFSFFQLSTIFRRFFGHNLLGVELYSPHRRCILSYIQLRYPLLPSNHPAFMQRHQPFHRQTKVASNGDVCS